MGHLACIDGLKATRPAFKNTVYGLSGISLSFYFRGNCLVPLQLVAIWVLCNTVHLNTLGTRCMAGNSLNIFIYFRSIIFLDIFLHLVRRGISIYELKMAHFY